MEPEKIKHLEFIQNIITRMNTNSFQIKTWTITIVSATLAIYASTKNEYFILIGILPTFIFWFLDANYLTQERRYRLLYTDVAGITDYQKDLKLFTMDIEPYKKEKPFCKAFWSATIRNLYLPVIIVLLVIFIYLIFLGKVDCSQNRQFI